MNMAKRMKHRHEQGKARKVINVGKMGKNEAWEYERRVKIWDEPQGIRAGEVGERENFKVATKKVAQGICRMKGVEQRRRTDWNQEMEQMRKEKTQGNISYG